MKHSTLTLILFFATIATSAQSSMWQSVDKESLIKIDESTRPIKPAKFELYEVNPAAISQRLVHATDRFSGQAGIKIDFPTVNGQFETFNVFKSGAVSKDFEIAHPEIQSFYGYSDSNNLNKIYFTITPLGFRGLITGERILYMDPYAKSTANTIMIYDRGNLSRAGDDDFRCHVTDVAKSTGISDFEMATTAKAFRDRKFRIYRIAIAATSEYTAYHNDGNNANGNARADALAGIVVTVTRVNSVFEQEMSMQFSLVANNANVIYFNETNAAGNSDPYDNYNGSTMLSANTTNLNNRIGTANYDIGHVFSTGGGGIAGTSPCDDGGAKGQGVTGIVTPEFDPFDIDYVCHEIGHQYGASHTFYNGCFGGNPSSTPVESGSASTIMGYAGICAPNVQENSDAYFHAFSLQQMQASIDGDTCETEINLGANNPTAPNAVNLTTKFIPISTPFKLTAISSQAPDAGEVYTYNWEQLDTGSAAAPGAPQPPLSSNSAGPMFRSKFATTSPTRYFPNLNEILFGQNDVWETLPSVSRQMTFITTIRDNNPNGGQTSQATAVLNSSTVVGPFVVNTPINTTTWYIGQNNNVTWDVAGTNRVELATQVNILLSLDGGYTYPITLATGVPNTGSYLINVPAGSKTDNARIMVESVGNYFFNVNNGNFKIKDGTFELTAATSAINVCAPSNVSFSFNYAAAPGFSQTATFSTAGLPAGLTASFSPTTRNANGSVMVTISGTSTVNPDKYDFQVVATTLAATITKDFSLKIFDDLVGDVVLTSPVNGASNQVANPLLQWQDLPSASSYEVEISATSGFTTILESAVVTNISQYQTTTLLPGNVYYWRVTPSNLCIAGAVASIGVFQTAQDVCITYDNEYFENSDNEWDSTTVNAVSARVFVTDDIQATNVSFYMNATHGDTGHIKMQLSAPTGRFAEVYNRECASGVNFNLTVSDQGTGPFGCNPGYTGPLTGNLLPGQAFSRFNGASAQGEWVLLATDRTAGVGGIFNEFSVTVCGRLQYVNDIINDNNNPLTVSYNGNAVIAGTTLSVSKSGISNANMVFTITKLPKYGTISKSGTALVLGDTFTQADINSNNIAYTHTATSLVYQDNFDFVVNATGNIITNAATYTIAITKPTLIYNNGWAPFLPSIETGDLNAQVLSGTAVINANTVINNLEVITGQLLELASDLSIQGSVTNNGTIDNRASGVLQFTGTNVQTVSGTGTLEIGAMQVSNPVGLTLNQSTNVYGVLDLQSSILNTGGNLTFNSDATSTGQLDNATGSTINGTVKVERYIPAKRAYRFLASTVNTSTSVFENWQENGVATAGNGTHITGSTTGANGFDSTSSGNPSMFGFDNDAQTWFAVANTNVQTLQVGTPWRVLVRGDRTIDLTTNTPVASNTTLRAAGSLHIGDFSTSAATVNGGFMMIANPYQAAIDLKDGLLLPSTTGINSNFAYVWDPNINTRGAYVTVSMSSANGTAVPASSQANKYLQPGQSFFVTTTGAASMTFTENLKAVQASQTAVFSQPTIASQISVTLKDATATVVKDQVVINMDNTYSNTVDANDAPKFSNIDETLAVKTTGINLAIERRDVPTHSDISELEITRYRDADYVFEIEIEQLSGLQVALLDRYLNTETVLQPGTNSVAFSVNNQIATSTASNRFAIVYSTALLSNDNDVLAANLTLYPNPVSNGSFTIDSALLAGRDVKVQIYNALGQLVHQENRTATMSNQIIPATKLATGMYIVKIATGNQIASLQILVK